MERRVNNSEDNTKSKTVTVYDEPIPLQPCYFLICNGIRGVQTARSCASNKKEVCKQQGGGMQVARRRCANSKEEVCKQQEGGVQTARRRCASSKKEVCKQLEGVQVARRCANR